MLSRSEWWVVCIILPYSECLTSIVRNQHILRQKIELFPGPKSSYSNGRKSLFSIGENPSFPWPQICGFLSANIAAFYSSKTAFLYGQKIAPFYRRKLLFLIVANEPSHRFVSTLHYVRLLRYSTVGNGFLVCLLSCGLMPWGYGNLQASDIANHGEIEQYGFSHLNQLYRWIWLNPSRRKPTDVPLHLLANSTVGI